MLPLIVFIVEKVLKFEQIKTKRNQVDLSTDNLAEKKFYKIIPKCGLPLMTLIFTLIYICNLHCTHVLIVKNENNEDNAKRLKELVF